MGFLLYPTGREPEKAPFPERLAEDLQLGRMAEAMAC